MDPDRPDEEIIREMVTILKHGGLIVFPTETFYGLGAHALDIRALENVYNLKGRPHRLPILCLIDGPDRLDLLVRSVPPRMEELMKAFWPGPLTLVFPAREALPSFLLGPTGGVAVRWSPHPVAQILVALVKAPVVGTSANITGEPPATRIQDLSRSVSQGVQGILDGGATPGGAPSTVLDCTNWPPKIVREGAVSRDALQSFFPC